MTSINTAKRFAGTALMWFFFGSIGLLLSIFLYPALYIVIRGRTPRQVVARKIIASTFGTFMRGGQRMGVFTYRVTGMQNVVTQGGQLVLANHPTLIDVVLLLSVLAQVDCVVKDTVITNPFMWASVTTANYISNLEPADLLDACVERLESGSSLLLFPEGTRTQIARPLNFRLGAAEVAIRADANILPIIVDCRPGFLAKNDPWYSIPAARPHFEVTILPAIPVTALIPAGLDRRQSRHKLNDALVSLFEAKLS